ncbi:MAG: proline dehydrogenase family protein [Melioribacteraceae bacterium]|nr:proline dehydrogenase family protein [Melioribacteraceae bacterium]
MKAVNNLIVGLVKSMPKQVVHIFAKKYIAGEKLDDGVKVVKELNSKGICATLDVLGESVRTKAEAREAKEDCLKVLDAIEENKLDSNLSIKPTQLGLAIDREFAFDLLKEILDRAKKYDNFVRIDMEDSSVTDDIFWFYEQAKTYYPKVGIVVQSYLKRNIDDVKRLSLNGTNYRLCKGIYVEPEEIAFKDRQEVRDKYVEALTIMLRNGNYVGIATHDDYLIDAAYKLIDELKIPKDKFEFQMLYGVKESLRDKINADGHKVRVYVPYGDHWYAYSIRRLQENPQVAWYITKSIFSLN